MRPFVVAANWKMHKSPRETQAFFQEFLPKLKDAPRGASQKREVMVFVPAINLTTATEILKGSSVRVGVQNCHFETKGAFTGENSPSLVAEVGGQCALVGHSERRSLFHESDDDTAKKVKALQQASLMPMLCVGEQLSEREAGQTNEVILRQLEAGLAGCDLSKPLMIAYEPVWAIGTGKVATPEQANEAHQVLREGLMQIGGQRLADFTPILYGGSVKPDNAAEIARQKEVDGFLVGGASLEVASFLALCFVIK